MAVTDLGGGRFRVRVYNPNMAGKQYQKVIVGKRAADLHEAEMKSMFARAGVMDPMSGETLSATTWESLRDIAAREHRNVNAVAVDALRVYVEICGRGE
jgi:hypothetical protein